MSGIPSGAVTYFPALTPAALDLSNYGAYGRRFDTGVTRVIDSDGTPLYAEVTVDESHDDTLVITEHPVEYGAAITDHSYKRPAEVRLRVGWSDAYVGGIGQAKSVYTQVLALQASRRPFAITTGKRQYTNMLIAELRTETNSGTEYSFLADITFREILLVHTVTIAGGAPTGDESTQAQPQATVANTPDGQRQVVPAAKTDAQVSSMTGSASPFGPGTSPTGPTGGGISTESGIGQAPPSSQAPPSTLPPGGDQPGRRRGGPLLTWGYQRR